MLSGPIPGNEGRVAQINCSRGLSVSAIQNALRENQNASHAILGRRIFGILDMRGLGNTP